ncbi:MAG: transporter substrate-binding protein [Hyphomicrobiales bacterium]|nr:transporter substrate-binding protein [Hyphomicrobiales bacterium]
MFMRRLYAVAGLCLAALSTPVQAADVVHVGILNTIGDIAVHIADARGYFAQEGIQADLIPFDASAKMIPSLGTGDLDVGGGATAASFFNAIDRKIGVRIVADKGRTEPGYIYQSVMIRTDLIKSGRFKSFADLKGLKFAQGAAGVGPWSVLNEAAKKGGVKYSEIEKVYLPFPQQVAALQSGAIDGSIMNEPFKTIVAAQGLAMDFSPTEDFFSTYELSLLFFGEKFMTERRDVAQRFMKAFLRGSRDYNDALSNGRWRTDGGADDVIRIFSSRTKTPEDLLRKITPQAADPDGKVALDSVRRDLAFFQEQGDVTNKTLKVEDCIDLSFAEAAAKALGPYVRKTP